MNHKKWEQFFDLIKEIVDAPGSSEEKKQEIIKEADLQHAKTQLDEFVGLFDGLLEEL